MLILNRTGDEHVDEFEFDAWFRSHTATEQEHFLRDMQRAKLGHLVHWATLSHLDRGQIAICLDSSNPKQALIDKILSSPSILGLLREDEAFEREALHRFVDRKIDENPDYLTHQVDRTDTDLTKEEREMIDAPDEGTDGHDGGPPSADARIRKMLTVPKIVSVLREESDKETNTGSDSPASHRLLYSTPQVLKTLVARRTLRQLKLGALFSKAQERRPPLDPDVLYRALTNPDPKKELLNVLAPLEAADGADGADGQEDKLTKVEGDGSSAAEIATMRDEIRELKSEVQKLTRAFTGAMSRQ